MTRQFHNSLRAIRRFLAASAAAIGGIAIGLSRDGGRMPRQQAGRRCDETRAHGELLAVTDDGAGLDQSVQGKIGASRTISLRLRRLMIKPNGIVAWHSRRGSSGDHLRHLGPDLRACQQLLCADTAQGRGGDPRRPDGTRIGGRTPAERRWSYCPPISCTTPATTTCSQGASDPSGRAAMPWRRVPCCAAASFRRGVPSAMAEANNAVILSSEHQRDRSGAALFRTFVIRLTAFLTVVDLFATQAILPSLSRAYHVSPAAMGFAVNASTMGMAVAGLAVACSAAISIGERAYCSAWLCSRYRPRCWRWRPGSAVFTALRIIQGLFMASAFTLTLAYLAEHCSAADTAGAFAAYITGNVASNLFGRLLSAALADHLGLDANFYVFALLNLTGAALVYFSLARTSPMTAIASDGRRHH